MANPIKTKATVSHLVDFGGGVYIVRLKCDQHLPRHKPGQFLHLTLDEYDPFGGFWPASRVFSIASSAGSEELQIVFSVKGDYTRRMSKELRVGSEVWLKLPFGDFVIDFRARNDQDVVLVAGGTGISPYIPFLSEMVDVKSRRARTYLAYGVRAPGLVIFEELLSRCLSRPGFALDLFVEGGDGDGLPEAMRESTHAGILSFEDVWTRSYAMDNPVYFLSGPPGMILFFRKRLLDAGVNAEKIGIDEWK